MRGRASWIGDAKPLVYFVVFIAALFLYAFISDRGKQNEWRRQHANTGKAVGVDSKDVVSPDIGANRRYTFRDRENSSFPPNPNQSTYPPRGYLLWERGGDLVLRWDFNKNVFWTSDPSVSVVSPDSDRVRIVDKSPGPPSQVDMMRVNHPTVVLGLESSDPEPHVLTLRLKGLRVSIAELGDDARNYQYRERGIPDAEIGVLVPGV